QFCNRPYALVPAVPAGAPTAAFRAAVAFVLGWEGGFTQDAGDHGDWTGGAIGRGALEGTNFGIASADYPSFLAALAESVAGALPASVKDLTAAEAETILQSLFWAPVHGDEMPLALAQVVFDAAVNSGVAQSGEWLQVVLGVATDGVIGPETLGAIGTYELGIEELCWEVLAQRIAEDGLDPNFPTFGLGWSRRTSALGFAAAKLL
ncbi:MAG: glycoside hydrolase family 108 protein, partial [Stellaceae bacterium]